MNEKNNYSSDISSDDLLVKKEARPVVSLCMPTNGIIEWVFPALNSIYDQGVDETKFEVVVTDNGHNEEFRVKMEAYSKQHSNLTYGKNNSYLFDNQLEAIKMAKGEYLKFVNHRGLFQPGALCWMINIIEKYKKEKPVIYFANGALKENRVCNNFDEFVKELGIFASWTTGVGIWKEDYDKIPIDYKYDKISPHSGILFSEKNKRKYIINNKVFSIDITLDHTNKGKYDVFKAFAIEEPTVTLNLFIDGAISADTLKKVKKDYRKFVSNLYWDFCIRKKPCSYDINGFNDSMGIFFDKKRIVLGAYTCGIKYLIRKIVRRKK